MSKLAMSICKQKQLSEDVKTKYDFTYNCLPVEIVMYLNYLNVIC